MNQQQQDELLALQSIFPDAVTFSFDDTTGATSVIIEINPDWGEDREVHVWDQSPPVTTSAKEESTTTESTEQVDEAPRISGVTPLTSRSNAPERGKRPSRGRGRGGGKASAVATPPPVPPPVQRTPAVLRLGTVAGEEPQLIQFHTKPPPAPPTLLPDPIPRVPEPAKLHIRYLPSYELALTLPSGYPEMEAPVPMMKGVGEWMPGNWKEKLEGALREVWMGDECIWTMVEMLQGESFMNLLDLKFPLVLRQQPDTPLSSSLSSFLSQHDRLLRSTTFQTENFTCEICLSAKKGHKCVRLTSCGDVFCLECLVSYFTMLITEGLVRSVHCPSVACVRARAAYAKSHPSSETILDDPSRPGEVTRVELLEMLGPERVLRWDWLREKVLIESDPSISFCPRQSCQAAVLKMDEDAQLRVCTKCSYSYCVFCRKGWHGTQTGCAISHSQALVEKYLEGTEEERERLEKTYGKQNVKKLVRVFEEDRSNREWMEENSKACPNCKINIEKSAGCNHMQCGKCNTHFCYRCGESLRADNPYPHFSTPGRSCYNKLFDFVPGNEPTPVGWWPDEL